MKEIIKSKLVKVGLIFSAFSFLYEYALPVKEPFFTALLMIADIGLLLLNLYYLESFRDKTKKQAIINAVLYALIYFSLISGLLMCAAEEKASLQALLFILETLVYLGPIIILLLPFLVFIAEFF